MWNTIKEETGNRYGRLVVIKKTDNKIGGAKWLCQCDCGNTTIVFGTALRQGTTKSCGCLNKQTQVESNTTHGYAHHPAYRVWQSMRNRCNNKNHHSYKNYGGKGITVCKEWEDVTTFMQWCLSNGYEKGLDLDRIDNDKGYYPENCRFVSRRQNIHNRNPLSSLNTSGYAGITILASGKFATKIKSIDINGGKTKFLGHYPTVEEAVIARNTFIIENNLPHKIQEIK